MGPWLARLTLTVTFAFSLIELVQDVAALTQLLSAQCVQVVRSVIAPDRSVVAPRPTGLGTSAAIRPDRCRVPITGGHRRADQARWYQVGNRKRQRKHGEGGKVQTADHPRSPSPTPTANKRSAVECDGAMVARSQVVVSGSPATLLGIMTNETGCDVHFSGMTPYAIALDSDGSEAHLLGDFNSPPKEQLSPGDWVMHPDASVLYRSVPVTLQTPDSPWDGTNLVHVLAVHDAGHYAVRQRTGTAHHPSLRLTMGG